MINSKIQNIELRPINRNDATVLMELNNCNEISSCVVGTPEIVSLEQQLKWMENLKNETNTVRWMIIFNGKAVGTIFVSSIDRINSVGNMNIKLLSAYQGQGIAKKAMLQACNLAFDELKLFCLTANILPYNAASCGLFKSIGFHQDGILRSRVVKNGRRFDLLTFSYLRTERT